ncbi:ABC transporter permease [Streptomyces sp. NBC_00047]|uniref:ABC transporter permease n=1 Tax=Streptomyces sp. NBC_00047 TaxID=2975627 RepID=UPI002257A555|nr:ABC transporter permease [Streptomyces sp. NBC_00047]MCX5611324.1 ABC transporter permease [Streptomyces sp. NBC_00047]
MTALLLRPAAAARKRPRTQGSWLHRASLGFAALVVLVALAAPWLAPHDPNAVDFGASLANPSSELLLGGDIGGRDTLSRLIAGARVSLLGPLCVVALSTLLGVVIGVAAAWRGGALDALLSRTSELLLAFPGLLLAMLLVSLCGRGLIAPVIALSLAYTPFVSRLARSLALAEAGKPYLAAYRVQGFSGAWICVRHLVPNIAPVVLAQSTVNFGYALLDLAALSFLGLGVPPLTPDWGAMINDGQSAILEGAPLSALAPCLAVILTVVAFNVVGERLADRVAGRTT